MLKNSLPPEQIDSLKEMMDNLLQALPPKG
jgi:hypothetical protein